MKIEAYIGGIFRRTAGDRLLSELFDIYPESSGRSTGDFFDMRLALDDWRTQRVLDILRQASLQRWNPAIPVAERDTGTFYDLVLHRIYDRSDLDQFKLFEFRLAPTAGLYSVERNADGLLRMSIPILPDDVNIDAWDFLCSATLSKWYIAPTRVRDILAAENLKELSFDPVETIAHEHLPDQPFPEPVEHSTAGGQFWEVRSDFVLPPLSPVMELTDKQRCKTWPGRSIRVSRHEGIFAWPELHYRASDLRAIEAFDVARTCETFWGSDAARKADYCPLIVSKRFYDVCQRNGFRVDWLPVHIDAI